MIRAAVLLVLALAAAGADEAPGFVVEVREISYSQRIDFVLGDGQRPFADEDQRRAQVVLGLRARGQVALLGWGGWAFSDAASDRGEALAIPVAQPEGVFANAHGLQRDPVIALPPVSLPLTRQRMAGLARLAGSFELRYATVAAAAVRIPAAELVLNQDRPIPGLEGGSIALTAPLGGDGRVAARLNAAAFAALQDLAFRDAAGVELPVRNQRVEWRDGLGLYTGTARAKPVAVEVRFYPAIERRRIALSFADLKLGLVLPGRDDLRGSERTGAEGF